MCRRRGVGICARKLVKRLKVPEQTRRRQSRNHTADIKRTGAGVFASNVARLDQNNRGKMFTKKGAVVDFNP